MATSTIVNTQIVVNFEDKFTESACQAMETYKKCVAGALQLQKQSEESARSLDLFSQGFEKLEEDATKANTALLALGIPAFILGLMALPAPIQVVIASLAVLLATWKAGEELAEWRVGGQPIEEYVGGVKESLDQLANAEPPALPPIPPETVQSLETTKTCLEHIQNMQDVLITINLLDNATEQAKVIRKGIEEIFSQDIVQRVTIFEETIRSAAPSFSGPSNSFFDDGLPEFQTSSPDLTGFNKSVGFSPAKPALPSFASGIDRVPRDMLALVHKDEAVLPKNLAEDFRRRGSSGMSIENLNFSFNVPNGAKLDREEFRNMAFMMRDELKRLDRRIN